MLTGLTPAGHGIVGNGWYVRDLAEAKLEDIEEKLRTLKAFKKALGKLVRECSQTGAKGACPILDAMDATETPMKKPIAKRSSSE